MGFTKKYKLKTLVYYETMDDVRSAIAREKQIKGWLRSKKIALIQSINPQWRTLSESWDLSAPDPSEDQRSTHWLFLVQNLAE